MVDKVKQGDEPGTHKKEETQSGKPCMKQSTSTDAIFRT